MFLYLQTVADGGDVMGRNGRGAAYFLLNGSHDTYAIDCVVGLHQEITDEATGLEGAACEKGCTPCEQTQRMKRHC